MTVLRVGASAVVALAAIAGSAAAEPSAATVAAWHQYVAEAEARLPPRGADPPQGSAITVPGGTIHHWRGSTIARSVTVDQVVHLLTCPGTAPPQDDVRESRVLDRSNGTLRVYLKLQRSVLVTVVYDTEHLVTFSRHSAGLATSRSVSTKIAEEGGGDRGFLWRLNSYWSYRQVGRDVRIDVESISLSRDVPWLVRPVAAPLVARVARESLVRTLESVRRFVRG